jgi:hypothetical protein
MLQVQWAKFIVWFKKRSVLKAEWAVKNVMLKPDVNPKLGPGDLFTAIFVSTSSYI